MVVGQPRARRGNAVSALQKPRPVSVVQPVAGPADQKTRTTATETAIRKIGTTVSGPAVQGNSTVVTQPAAQKTRPAVAEPAAQKLGPNTPVSASQAASAGASPLPIFLTNLRLLDLDLLPDWPGLTADIFASTGVQGQKKRTQCVEWVLVKLFEIWDPEETAAKLEPLFPPLDQIQSVNLRAALLRALENVKKNGALGRDAIVRKTMLDDCKGERLEEILAYFSTAVVKRVLEKDSSANHKNWPIAMRLSFENRGYDSDNFELKILLLAYGVSLRRFLEHKEDVRALYRDFEDLLGVKERRLNRRLEAVQALEANGAQDPLSDETREEVVQLVRDNWSGNAMWMKTLLQGDSQAQDSGLLTMPFDRVWRRVRQGRLAEIENSTSGLLEQLDNRVRVQRERLARWDTYRRDSFGESALPRAPPMKNKDRTGDRKPSRGIDLGFTSHQDLQVGRPSKRLSRNPSNEPILVPEHAELVNGLKNDLAAIKGTDSSVQEYMKRFKPETIRAVGSTVRPSPDDGEASQFSELEDDSFESATMPIPVRTNRARLDSLRPHAIKPQTTPFPDPDKRGVSPQPALTPPDPPSSPESQQVRQTPAENLGQADPSSPTRDLADEILESMDQFSPSPLVRRKQRPPLTLAQRTRLSMAGNRSPHLFDDEEPDLPLRPTPPSEPEPSTSPDKEPGAMDLASRTRLSMAALGQAQKKAQLERRKSLRQPRGPPSPRKGDGHFPTIEEESKDHTLLTEELLQEEDMEAVFKSRPKMRTSPVGSPTRNWGWD